jgi:hypothetical protein
MKSKLTLLLPGLLLAGWMATHCAAAPDPKPNVLFLVADDLRPELGCDGVAELESPTIDQFAQRGLVFDCPNTLTEKEKTAGWQLLFNGKDPTGWRAYKTPEGPGRIAEGWTVGQKIKGHVMLTDHGDEAWFRNITIREFPKEPRPSR